MQNDYLDLNSVREKHEEAEQWRAAYRRHWWFTAAIGFVVGGLAVAAWYAYPMLQRHDASLKKLSGLEDGVGSLVTETKGLDDRVSEWTIQQQVLRDQLGRLSRDVQGRVKQSSEAASAMIRRTQSEVEARIGGVDRRVAELEASNTADQARIAGLQRQVQDLRGDLTRQSDELAVTRRDVGALGVGAEKRFNAIEASEHTDRSDVDAISTSLAVERVPFEVSKGHSRELAPGISMGLTKTDVAFRRVEGWMWIMPDRRTIWLRGHGSQEPVVFYGLNDGKKREVVITSVGKDSIAGYVLLPKQPGTLSASR